MYFAYRVWCWLLVIHFSVILFMAMRANEETILLGKHAWACHKCNALVHADNSGTVAATKDFSPIATRATPLNEAVSKVNQSKDHIQYLRVPSPP
jgi:hypothetical protein